MKIAIKNKWIGSIILILIIVFLVYGGIQSDLGAIETRKYYKETDAYVKNIDTKSELTNNGDNVTYYYVYIDYEAEGEEYKDVFYGKREHIYYKEGDTITILYDTRDTSHISMPTSTNKAGWVAYSFAGVVGIVLIYYIFSDKIDNMKIEKKKQKYVRITVPIEGLVNNDMNIYFHFVYANNEYLVAKIPVNYHDLLEEKKMIDVYIKPSDFENIHFKKADNYFVDFDSLKKGVFLEEENK